MKLSSFIVWRPVSFSFILAFLMLILPSLLIPCWYGTIKSINRHIYMNSYKLHHDLQSEIEKMTVSLQPIKSSAVNLARVLNPSPNESTKTISFYDIKTTVAPILFEGLSIIPYLSQASYIGSEGLFFSYYTDHINDQTLAVYSNSTTNSELFDGETARNKKIWYTQPVNPDTGELYGNVSDSRPFITNITSFFQDVSNRTYGYSSLETKWDNSGGLVFLVTSRINEGNGVVSLGFLVKDIVDFFYSIESEGGFLYLATKEGKVFKEGLKNVKMEVFGSSVSFQLLEPNGDQVSQIGNISCKSKEDGVLENDHAQILNIMGTDYTIYCSPLEILGVQSVYVMGFPQNGLLLRVVRKNENEVVILVLMIVTMVISIFSFVLIIVRAAKREMHLCAKLIGQMEATQQAERKSMNKSHALVAASHDIRAFLAGVTGLIELCNKQVPPGSELHSNLTQMDVWTKDLVGILNTILDTSKIEAGMMQLEEEEFDLGKLLEDVVDLYHLSGVKKGIDVVLDPYDGSIIKFSQVKGDGGKLKQIFCNLLNNAVKFTKEGHVTVRAWAKGPNFHHKIMASEKNGMIRRLSFLFSKNKKAYDQDELEAMNIVQQNPNCMEFVFEVDDTGEGIPKEKRKSVFEHYVQVKETTLGQGGTGLGLAIVQSLVRLMHGDIAIMDKEIEERGTCFRFNVFLTICDSISSDNNAQEEDIESRGEPRQSLNLTGFTANPEPSIQYPSPRLGFQYHSPNQTIRPQNPQQHSSRIVLLIQGDQRRMVSQKFMERLGIRVSTVKQWQNLSLVLEEIMDKQNHSRHSSRGKSETSSPKDHSLIKSISLDSTTGTKDVPLSAMDETNYVLSSFKKSPLKGSSRFILIVIDASAGPFNELCEIVAKFKRGLLQNNACCKVVWLENPMSQTIDLRLLQEESFHNDIVRSKPFHGSRLYEVVRFLPEFGGNKVSKNPSPSRYRIQNKRTERRNSPSSSSTESPKMENLSQTQSMKTHFVSQSRTSQFRHQEMAKKQYGGEWSSEKPLGGKKILVAEDNLLLQKYAEAKLLNLGCETVKLCQNGKEALELVSEGLESQRKQGASNILPYDYILMDCEMPIMNGYEATQQIREREKNYKTRIPIIALTAHTSGVQLRSSMDGGMDVHLGKPLTTEHLLIAIKHIHSKTKIN